MSTINNPAKLTTLAYRASTYAQSLSYMQANLRAFAIPSGPNAGTWPLAALTTRASDDPTIALLDAWAMVIDVLTFYQERIANEGYVRTATERLSLIQLASAVGYQLNPGLAAATALAFAVETAAGTPGAVTVPIGTQVQSVPVQGQLPQFFETTAAISARAEWNALRPLLTQPQQLATSGGQIPVQSLTFMGTSLALQPGALLWVSGQSAAVTVTQVQIDAVKGTTTVGFRSPTNVVLAPNPGLTAQQPKPIVGLQVPLTPENVATYILPYAWQAPQLDVFLRQLGWDPGAVQDIVAALTVPVQPTSPATVSAFGQKVGFLGRTLPEGTTITSASATLNVPSSTIWLGAPSTTGASVALLEQSMSGIAVGSTVVLVDSTPSGSPVGFLVSAVADQAAQIALPSIGGSAPTPHPSSVGVTALALPTGSSQPPLPITRTTAYVQSRQLPLAPTVPLAPTSLAAPVPFPAVIPVAGASTVSGASVVLSHIVVSLMPGQTVTLTGTRVDPSSGKPLDPPGATQSETMTLLAVASTASATTLTFTAALQHTYTTSSPISVAASTLVLDHMALGLEPGQLVALTGQRVDPATLVHVDPPGVTQTEIVTLASVVHAGVNAATGNPGGYTAILLDDLQNTYDLTTLTLNANVAPATHGQTVAGEVLGSGDGSQQNQRFVLAKPNLTYLPAATSSGGASTITVRVNGVAWQEVPALFGQTGPSRAYAVRIDDQGKTTVVFGDGQAGARLPTGRENVTATYRTGLGPSGNVAAGALTLLFNRPLGIRSVQNPLPATGGVAPQVLDDARAAAPRTVRTLDRIVTISDYEDFTSNLPGVGKAQAALLEIGGSSFAHLTVAAAGGVEPANASATAAFLDRIQRSIAPLADPSQVLLVDLCNTRFFGVTATLVLQPGVDPPSVRAAAERALENAFSFAARSFGQGVLAFEVLLTLQRVPGVLGVELQPLAFADATPGSPSGLVARPAQVVASQPGVLRVAPTDLILISPAFNNLTSTP